MHKMVDEAKPTYKISIDKYGGLNVEAPTKDECLDMLNKVSQIKTKSTLDDAIR
jgi:hypothetical protein